jgi:hypothetical protein
MTWRDMGQIAPTPEWQLFPFSTTGEVFQLLHTWRSTGYWRPRALIAQFWGGDQVYAPRRLWAINGTSLEFLKIPEPYAAAGLNLRQVGVKLLTPYYPTSLEFLWSIEMQVFDPPVSISEPDLTDSYRLEFSAPDLLDGRLIVPHNLGQTPTAIQVTDSDGEMIQPDGIRILNDDTVELDFRSFDSVDDWDINIEV